jgi:hypothetical protein
MNMPNELLGDPSFRWWWGCVEDRIDPLQKGRVRVRIHSYHSPFKKDIPTDALPWAEVVQPATTGNTPQSSPVGLAEGLWVFGFFKDGNECQQPVVLGWLPTLPEEPPKEGTKGTDTLQQKDSEFETFQKNYGDGFRDPRKQSELKEYPSKEVKRKYPFGKNKVSKERGVQLEEKEPKKQTDRHGRAIAINDATKIKDTIIQLKKTPRPDGLYDKSKIADIKVTTEKFECGVVNKTGVNKGTLSGLGAGNNSIESTMLSSEFDNWKLTKEKPLNCAEKEILG